MTDRLLTAREVAELLGLSPASVLRRWRSGELPGYRLGSNVLRFSEADVEAFLAERRRGGPAPLQERKSAEMQPPADARAFLSAMPTADELMPAAPTVAEIEAACARPPGRVSSGHALG